MANPYQINDGESMASVRSKLNQMGEAVDGAASKEYVDDKVPSGGTAGQVLTKTETGTEWKDSEGGLPELGEPGQVLTVTGGRDTQGRDTQGPAPDGYHVPTTDEWKAVYDMGVALGQWSGSNGDSFRIKMKMPFAGNRSRSTSSVSGQGSEGYYWSSTAYSADSAYHLSFSSSSLGPQDWSNRARGFSVRCFRNSPLQPSSSWTTIYEGSNGAGIYHNPTEGVISISSDGQIWITLADKNLGATTVYNDGDTLSQANCGNYYQWGNNYGFPWTGNVTTSSTKVDASSYGPGNYYSSSTFITASSSPYDWSSVQNNNLRGGVTDERPEKKAEWKDIEALPEGGTAGQVLTKTSTGTAWQDAAKGGSSLDVLLQTEYDNLSDAEKMDGTFRFIYIEQES